MKWFPIGEFLQGTLWPNVLCSFLWKQFIVKTVALYLLLGKSIVLSCKAKIQLGNGFCGEASAFSLWKDRARICSAEEMEVGKAV